MQKLIRYGLALILGMGCSSRQAPLVGSLVPSYSVDFGQEQIGQQATRTVDLVNSSSTAFHVTSVGTSTDPQFGASVVAGTVIPAQGELTLPVTFTPASSGPQSGAIVLGTDDPAVPQITLAMQGQGVTTLCPSISPQALDFGNVAVGTTVSRVVTLTNGTDADCQVTPGMLQGPQAALFAIDQTAPFTLPAGGLVDLDVSYAPVAPSSLDTASFTLTSSTSGEATVAIKGGALASCLAVMPLPLDFGFVPPGIARTLALHLSNACGTPIDVTSVSLADPGASYAFSLASQAWTGGVLNPGVGVDVGVNFAPAQIDSYAGEIDFALAGDTTVQVATLTGFGGGASITCTPLALDFGITAVGISTSLPLLCTNTGVDVPGHPEAGLVITTLTSSDPLFIGAVDPQSQPQPIAAGNSVQIDAVYTPTATTATADTGTLTINSNATDGTNSAAPAVSLTGRAVAEQPCTYTVTPSSLNFGQVKPGTQVPGSVVISNTGPNECVVTGLNLSLGTQGVFTLASGPVTSQRLSPVLTPPGPYPTQLSVNVDFLPQQTGNFSGAVLFTISDPSAPQQRVNLSGVGGNSCFLISPQALDFGTVGISNGQFCSNAKRKFVGVNGCAKSVTIQSVTLETGDDVFSFLSETVPETVTAGQTSSPFEVGFKPQMAGTYTGSAAVATDLQATSFGVGFSGTAVAANPYTDVFAGGATAFPLSGIPDPTSIVLYVDGPPPGQSGTTGVEIPPGDPGGATNWTYDAPSNAVIPDPLNLSLSTTDSVYIQYRLVCE